MNKLIIAAVLFIVAATSVYAGCRYACWTDDNGTRHCQYTCE